MISRSVRHFRGQEDPLAFLTATVPAQYRKGAVIYSALKQAGHLHLILRGQVKVSRQAAGRSVVIDVYGPEDFFGECALLGLERLPEEAVALEKTEVMQWSKPEIEQLLLARPQLAVGLMQTLAKRSMDFGTRLQNFLGVQTAERVLRTLIGFSERSGTAGEAGSVHLTPVTHRLLADYTGTSREIVTQHMNEFRRQGLLSYSRRGIVLTPRAFQVAERGSYRGRRQNDTVLDGTAA